MVRRNINRTATRLALAALGMFAFGYAMVPLYEAYCDLTGRGSEKMLSEAAAGRGGVDEERLVTVVFDANTRDLPWSFKSTQHKQRVRPGELSRASFMAENKSERVVTGRAIPSVSPVQAGVYLKKTECFCFSEQALAPGESKEMEVRFVVDANLPKRFSSLTLSYTFFGLDDSGTAARRDSAGAGKVKS